MLVQQELTKKLNGSKTSWELILLTITKKLILERSWKMTFRKALIVFLTMLVDQVQSRFWLIWTWKAELLLLEQCQGIYYNKGMNNIKYFASYISHFCSQYYYKHFLYIVTTQPRHLWCPTLCLWFLEKTYLYPDSTSLII